MSSFSMSIRLLPERPRVVVVAVDQGDGLVELPGTVEEVGLRGSEQNPASRTAAAAVRAVFSMTPDYLAEHTGLPRRSSAFERQVA